MFERHQAEITVMQFRGHSLPVHQSMSVSWAFTLSHFVSQFRRRDFFRLLTIGMCHFLPVHHFGIACLVGSKVNIQQNNFTISLRNTLLFKNFPELILVCVNTDKWCLQQILVIRFHSLFLSLPLSLSLYLSIYIYILWPPLHITKYQLMTYRGNMFVEVNAYIGSTTLLDELITNKWCKSFP